jgi:hypothetical protein
MIWGRGMVSRAQAKFVFTGLVALGALTASAWSQTADRAAVRREVQQLQKARHDKMAEKLGKQATPGTIPQHQMKPDPSGAIETFQARGATVTRTNAFFQDLGSNGRTCFSCHQPDQGWSVSSQGIQARFDKTGGLDPIFRPVDGATCPTADTSSLEARRNAYSLLLNQGLIRVGLPFPAGAEFTVVSVADPYHCNTDPVTGMTSQSEGTVSVYRRPLPSTNLRFLSTVMWDGREGGFLPPPGAPADQPSLNDALAQQAIDATTGHAQAANPPTLAQVKEIVDFELGLTTAQGKDNVAGKLTSAKARGGAAALDIQPFFVGMNDPLGLNPDGTAFTSTIFDIYDAWSNVKGSSAAAQARVQIARGQAVFNSKPINITGVAGLNDATGTRVIAGSCGTCHDAPNAGDHSVKAPLDIGLVGAGADAPPALNIAALPVFTVSCSVGAPFHPANTPFQVTDLGRATLTGKCADIGKTKGPVLRGLAARAPYFHNGSAATLMDAVNFYDQRFHIGFTAQEKSDLVAFLNTL